MNIAPMSLVMPGISPLLGINQDAPATSASFADWMTKQVSTLNSQLVDADTKVRELALGEAENLHQVMISLEKAKLSFQLAMQVRNKLLDAYQEIMRMQV